jgi:hypothetical protein
MRVTLALSVMTVAFALSAPVAHAQAVARGNDTGGIISWSCENEAAAPAIAAAYCAGWGKYPRISSVRRQYGDYIAFHCLWTPYQARWALPAVPTRSACVAVAKVRLSPRVRVRY